MRCFRSFFVKNPHLIYPSQIWAAFLLKSEYMFDGGCETPCDSGKIEKRRDSRKI